MIVGIQPLKAIFRMLNSHYHSNGKPRSRSPRVNTFPFIVSYLFILLGSPSTWAVTVTSGPTLTLDPNGTTPLAGVINLNTDLPARVTLEVSDGNESRTIKFAEFKTDFSLPVLGLKPDKKYSIKIRLTDQNNQQLIVAPALQASTDPLPDDFPDIRVVVSEPALMEPGYTMMAKFFRTDENSRFISLRILGRVLKETLWEWTCWAIGWATDSCSDVVDDTSDRVSTFLRLGRPLKQTLWDWTCWAIDWRTDYCPDPTAPRYTIIVDDAGDVVWYSTLGDSTNYQLEDGTLLYWDGLDVIGVDLLGNEIRRVTLDVPGTGLTHDMFPTVDQTYLSITMQQATVQDFPVSYTDPNAQRITANVEDNPIVEFDLEGNLLNIWPLVDMLDKTRIGYQSLNLRDLGHDWAHVNSVVYDPRDDSIVISLRHQDAVVKFSHSTGDLKWILGSHANWSPEFQPFLLTPAGEPFEWQYHQHAAEITPSGTILMFDNGNLRASPFDGNAKTPDMQNYSRAVEYAIDEQNMEIRQVWEYGKDIAKPLYAGHIGSANWMKTTGNVLITFGGTSVTGGVHSSKLGLGTISTRIIEVTHDTPAVKAFDMLVYDPAPRARLQVYRSERIPDLYPVDTDADGVPDYRDNCVLDQNGPLIPGDALNSQLNTDGDSAGDICDDDDDNDGMTDAYEVENQLDPLDQADASLDKDGDGLSNLEEFQLGSSTNNANTDSDGMNDGAEGMVGRNPAVHEGVGVTRQLGP
jgi:hypothetical protein